jgi:hypothetical protein
MAFLSRPVTARQIHDVPPEGSGDSSGTWEIRHLDLSPDDYLVVVTQTCDIVRSPTQEPYVEAMRAYWTSDRAEIHQAQTNSVRRYLLRRRVTSSGSIEALIADATVRVQVDKVSLLELSPEPAFDPADTSRLRGFGRWLGDRYSRQPLPDHLVRAVQAPVVEAVRKLRPGDERLRLLEDVRELLFVIQGQDFPPYQVELWFLANDGDEVAPPIAVEGAARLAGWLQEVLERRGQAALVHWERFDTRTLSVHDYINAYQLPLEAYTLTEESGREL